MQISLSHICKTFRGKAVLDDMSVYVEHGEMCVILGESGSGKTTLLRLIAGLEKPDSGTLSLGDTKVCGNGKFHQPYERNVGLIFQDLALWPHLSVYQNCEIVLRHRVKYRKERNAMVSETLERFRIADLSAAYPHTLSAGERQRVSLARAIIAEPAVLLLDEPLNNLDVHLKAEISEMLRDLHARQNLTTIYVTHDFGEALLLGTRACILSAGKISHIGATAEIVSIFTSGAYHSARHQNLE